MNKTANFNCEGIEYLLERDQRFRVKHSRLLSPSSYFLDSLLFDRGISEGIGGLALLDDTTRKQLLEKVEYLKTNMEPPLQRTIDSIWSLQKALDYKNTELLIDMILSQGEMVFDTLPYKCGREALIVFVHSPDELKEKVEKTINHINLKEIDEPQYNHIMWHLNGRGKH